jgi:hypothetical protein
MVLQVIKSFRVQPSQNLGDVFHVNTFSTEINEVCYGQKEDQSTENEEIFDVVWGSYEAPAVALVF